MKQRIDIQLLRILAIFLVIYNHLPAYSLYTVSDGLKQLVYMVLTMITRINVPIFFMIAGTLLLSKTEAMEYVLRHRVRRIILSLIFFTLILFSFNIYISRNIENIDLLQYINNLLKGEIPFAGSYWYLYAYIGFLLILPFLQRAVKGMTKSDFMLLIIVHFIYSSFLPLLNIVLTKYNMETIVINSNLNLAFANSKYLFYPIIGYYIDKNIDVSKFTKRTITLGSLVAFTGIILSCIPTYYQGITTGTYTQDYVQLFDYCTAIYAFLLIKYIINLKSLETCISKYSNIINLVGTLTFGMYLLDPVLKIILYNKYFALVNPLFPVIIVSGGWCIISMVLGGGISYIMQKLPITRRFM